MTMRATMMITTHFPLTISLFAATEHPTSSHPTSCMLLFLSPIFYLFSCFYTAHPTSSHPTSDHPTSGHPTSSHPASTSGHPSDTSSHPSNTHSSYSNGLVDDVPNWEKQGGKGGSPLRMRKGGKAAEKFDF